MRPGLQLPAKLDNLAVDGDGQLGNHAIGIKVGLIDSGVQCDQRNAVRLLEHLFHRGLIPVDEDDGDLSGFHVGLTADDLAQAAATLSVENDWAYAGLTLPIMQLYTEDAREYSGPTDRLYANCTRLDAVVTVGGVLDKQPDSLNGLWGSVLTTEQGLRNMGLNRNGYVGIQIYLDGEVDADTEEELTQSINAIARRAEGSRVVNNMETAREDARSYYQLLVLMGAIALVFFAVSAGMILSTVTQQLQADGKRIGMLRAVGADEKTILGCYSGQVFLSLALGMALAVVILVCLDVGRAYCSRGIAAIVLFSGSCLGLCILLLRRRVRQVTSQSIIENIREL